MSAVSISLYIIVRSHFKFLLQYVAPSAHYDGDKVLGLNYRPKANDKNQFSVQTTIFKLC